jgi:hypothetical protein
MNHPLYASTASQESTWHHITNQLQVSPRASMFRPWRMEPAMLILLASIRI